MDRKRTELLADTTEVIVTDLIKLLLIAALDGLAVAVDDCLGRNDAVFSLSGVDVHDLELDRVEASDDEGVALAKGTVGGQEVGLEIGLEEVALETLNGVIEGKNADGLGVRDLTGGVDGDDIAQLDTEVLANNLIHTDDTLGDIIIGDGDTDSIVASLAFNLNSVTTEKIELLHLSSADENAGVVTFSVITCANNFINDKTVRAASHARSSGGICRGGSRSLNDRILRHVRHRDSGHAEIEGRNHEMMSDQDIIGNTEINAA